MFRSDLIRKTSDNQVAIGAIILSTQLAWNNCCQRLQHRQTENNMVLSNRSIGVQAVSAFPYKSNGYLIQHKYCFCNGADPYQTKQHAKKKEIKQHKEASQIPEFQSKLQQLFQRKNNLPVFLERVVGEKHGTDNELWKYGKFAAEVYPDLPEIDGWRKGLKLARQNEIVNYRFLETSQEFNIDKWLIVTVAAQLRCNQSIRRNIMAACALDDRGENIPGRRPADAILFVSGSHPGRLQNDSKVISTTLDMLSMASDMRAHGEIPAGSSFWAVANPNSLADMNRIKDKFALGADVVITQPPFLLDKFQQWLERDFVSSALYNGKDFERSCKLVVGVPIITSPQNLQFWFKLCSMIEIREAVDVQQLKQLEQQFQDFYQKGDLFGYNDRFISRVLELPFVSGVHVMPINQKGRQLTIELLEGNKFSNQVQV
eukprot:TRINITY_DN12143_c1_g1_i1.p1 TRINITY_DN12143_c1_g1~~TRINITY_DN12143_c1_g1_i1.p1  ORF type:complete len:430 (-),score=28.50 TRINITY_DN12143_c1_g1_i1:136-1425(-)